MAQRPESAAQLDVGLRAQPKARPVADRGLRWRADARRRRMLAAADVLAGAVSAAVLLSGQAVWPWVLAPLPIWILAAKLLGLYDRDHQVIRHLTIDEIAPVLAWAGIVAVLTSATVALTEGSQLAIVTLAGLFALLTATDLTLRVGARYVWRRTNPPARCLVVGEGAMAAGLTRKLDLFTDMHMVEAGIVHPATLNSSLERDPERVRAILDRVDRVVVATSSLAPEMVSRLAGFCREAQVKLSAVSPLQGRAVPAPRITQVADLPVLEFDISDVSRSTIAMKRCFDVVVASFALLLMAPLIPLIVLAIRLDSRGPAIFTQLRAGLHGEPFRLYKFRTMRNGAEHDLADVVDLEDLDDPVFKLRKDPRLTRVGRVLRRLSLDEVPQFFNVLKGEMSVVGPRPEQVELVERYSPEDRFRLEVTPGVTGPMQVHGRGELSFAERLALDLDYIENLSLARDLRIIALTFPTVLKRRGAY
jgi:exopolysaccharide biosynthesis polyprenyl glycosylphosphotransferase